ncbi:hypothetical protein TrST_g8703 [Triparma strigata]|uniref:Uncharacterized protein n=1 Tax=Triparma strigata TaxID=1606541 RepID=A0A9W6ZCG9_9STRA|nr:hypothetical protein TrST_g8703 [Triparma strigata]
MTKGKKKLTTPSSEPAAFTAGGDDYAAAFLACSSQMINTLKQLSDSLDKKGKKKSVDLELNVNVDLLKLKRLNRYALMDLAKATDSLEGAKKSVDQASLDLQNLLYEKEHLQREIQMAKELQCKELTSLQAAEGEDVVVSMGKPKTQEEHKANLDRLAGRLEKRRELKRTLEEVEEEKKRLIQENSQKKEFLASLPHHLQQLNAASEPLRKYMKLSAGNQDREKYDAARTLLCKELYVVFCNLVSFGEDVCTVSCVRFSPKIKAWFAETNGEDYKSDEVEVLRPHAHSVEWSLGNGEVVKFNYLPDLQIITVESATPMLNLFPSDTGISTPNATNHHTYPDYNSGDGIVLPPKDVMPARPFVWAQWIGGMYFAVKEGTRVEPSIRTIVRMVKMRVRAYKTLGELLEEIGGLGKGGSVNELKLHPSCDWLSETSATLSKWEEVESGEEERVFKCVVTAGKEVLGCRVFVGIDYPVRAPKFEFSRVQPGNKTANADGNLKELEMEINTRYESLADNTLEDGMDFILTHQIRRLCAVWEKIATGTQWGSIGGVRVRKGKDRKKAIAFD